MKYFSIVFLFVIVSFSVLAPVLFTYQAHEIHLSKSFTKPSLSHVFGLDENGQDLFVKVIYGARISLLVVFSVIGLSFFIGLLFGTLAGYLGSYVEVLIMSVADLTLAFPKFLMALALIAMLGSSLFHLIFALSFSTWAGFARLVRGEIKHLKQKEFVLQAKSSGAGHFFLIRRHIWPGILGLMAIHGIFQGAAVLIAESGLSFLGLGVSLEQTSWGSLLGSGREYIFEAPHIIFFPSLVLFLFLLSLNYLGEFLRDHLDPHR